MYPTPTLPLLTSHIAAALNKRCALFLCSALPLHGGDIWREVSGKGRDIREYVRARFIILLFMPEAISGSGSVIFTSYFKSVVVRFVLLLKLIYSSFPHLPLGWKVNVATMLICILQYSQSRH